MEARLLEGFDKGQAVSDVWRESLAKLPVNLSGLLLEERAPGGRAFCDEKHVDLRGPQTCREVELSFPFDQLLMRKPQIGSTNGLLHRFQQR